MEITGLDSVHLLLPRSPLLPRKGICEPGSHALLGLAPHQHLCNCKGHTSSPRMWDRSRRTSWLWKGLVPLALQLASCRLTARETRRLEAEVHYSSIRPGFGKLCSITWCPVVSFLRRPRVAWWCLHDSAKTYRARLGQDSLLRALGRFPNHV